jgi:hypothetical protein
MSLGTAMQETLHCVGLGIAQMNGSAINADILMNPDKFHKAFQKYVISDIGETAVWDWVQGKQSWIDSVVLNVNALIKSKFYKGKYKIYRNAGLMNDVYTQFLRLKKQEGIKLPNDKWNPGDIWAFASGVKLKDFSSLDEYNEYISKQLQAGRILGISLKKSSGSAKVEYVNQSDDTPPKIYKYKGTQKPRKIFATGITVLTDSSYIINCRSFRISKNATVRAELGIKGSAARHGKKSLAEYIRKHNLPQTSLSEIKKHLKDVEFLKGQIITLWKDNGHVFTEKQIEASWEKLKPDYRDGNQSSGYYLSIINALEFGAFLYKNKAKGKDIINDIIREASSKDANSSDFIKVY